MVFRADAICINQRDLEERASQVSMMRTIYSKAVEVVAWLGIQSDGSDDVIDYINDIPMKWKSPSEPVLQEGVVLDPNLAQRLLCITQRPFWARVWIIQELVTPRTNIKLGSVTIHCGEKEFGLFRLGLLEEATQAQLLSRAPQIKSILRLRTAYHGEMRIPFLMILYDTRHAKATDPRDKVFAILGLTSDGVGYVYAIDYRKSVEELSIEITRFAIEQQKSLDILGLKPLDGASYVRLPSWTPPWFQFNDPYLLRMVRILTERSSLDSHLDIPLDDLRQRSPILIESPSLYSKRQEDLSVLTVEGYYVTHITHLSYANVGNKFSWRAIPPSGSLSRKYVQSFCKYGHEIRTPPSTHTSQDKSVICNHGHLVQSDTLSSPYTEADFNPLMASIFSLSALNNPQDVPFSALFTDGGVDLLSRFFSPLKDWLRSLRTFGFSFHGRNFDEWIQSSLHVQHEWSSRTEKISSATLNSWLRSFMTVIQNRVVLGMRLVVASNGMMGWAHANTQMHDRIYVLPGCRFPVVLRPENLDAQYEGRFHFVGDASFVWPESVIEELKKKDLVSIHLC